MTWAAIAVGTVSAVAGYAGSQSSGADSGGGPSNVYSPTGLGAADSNWQWAYDQSRQIGNNTQRTVDPYYAQTLQQQQNINYQPWQQSADQAGRQYSFLSNEAGMQGNQYGQNAQIAGQQQQALYGAGNQIYQTAFDPNQALFHQGEQQLQDQVRAGQAARGLGNSAVGASEENQAMSNYDLNWRQQQLQNEATGISAMSGASNAGGTQGQLQGANMAAQIDSYGQMPGFTQQAGQLPIQSQQYIAGMPAQNASTYAGNEANSAGIYGNQMNQATQYMGMGSTMQNNAWNNQFAQNQYKDQQNQMNSKNMGNFTGQVAGGLTTSYNTPGSWLNNMFSNKGAQGAGTVDRSGTYDPNVVY